MQYSSLELWLLIALLSLVTLVSRSFFVLLPRRWQPRGRVEQALRYAPLAALLAITVPEVVRQLPTALQQTRARLGPRHRPAAGVGAGAGGGDPADAAHAVGPAGRHRHLPAAVAAGRLSVIIAALLACQLAS